MKRMWRWLLSPIFLVLTLTLSHNVFAQNVQWGFSMDQAFNSYIYTNDGLAYIPGYWTNLPWNNPSGWPIQGNTNNLWENKPYTEDGTAATQTVTAGQSFYLSVPQSLEDGCRVSNYGTRGYWRDLMVIENLQGGEAWSWNPPGGNWYSSTSTDLNNNATYCSPGSNYSGSWGFELTAPSVTTTTTYDAKFFAEEGQYTSSDNYNNVDGDISEITVPITVRPAPVVSTITLSANPTSLTVGQSTSLSAAASSNMPGGDYIVIQNTSLGWPDLNYATSGNTTNWSDYTGQTSFTVTDQGPTSPNIWDYKAYILSGPGQIVAQSNPVSVTWDGAAANPTVSLSANPTSLTVGNSTSVTASANNMPGSDYLEIEGTDGQNQDSDTGASTASMSDTQYSPITVNYTAYVYNSAGQTVATSNSVSVTWTSSSTGGGGPPSITLTANPTSLSTDQTTTLSATASNMAPGDFIVLVGTDSLDQNGSSNSTTFVTTDVQYSPTMVTYTAYVQTPAGLDVTSAQATVTWTASGTNVTLNLTGNPPTLFIGQSTTLTASANQPFANAALSAIVPVSGVSVTTTGGTSYGSGDGTPVSGDSYNWDVMATQPGSATFQLRWSATGTGYVGSNYVTITWTAPPTVSLAATPTNLLTGQATTVTATASENVETTSWFINVVDLSSGQVVASCGSGTTCTANVTERQATTQQFEANIGPSQAAPSASGVQATSNIVSVTWTSPPSVTLSANPTSLPTGRATTLTATATNLPSGDHLVITGSGTGSMAPFDQSGSVGASIFAPTDTHHQAGTMTYTAAIDNASGQSVATSSPASVVWTQPAPAITGCVPNRPGYEYVHGQPTYNPQACPVPTPVNF